MSTNLPRRGSKSLSQPRAGNSTSGEYCRSYKTRNHSSFFRFSDVIPGINPKDGGGDYDLVLFNFPT